MNVIKIFIFLVMFVFVAVGFANGNGSMKNIAKSPQCNHVYKTPRKIYHGDSLVRVKLYPGSLRNNIKRIARQNGWKNVIWGNGCGIDYRWVSRTTVVGTDFKDVMDKIFVGYPLQAVFYEGNHVLVIKPRTLK